MWSNITIIGTAASLLAGGLLGMVADRFAYWFHVSRQFLWRDHCKHCFSPQAWYRYLPVLGLIFSRGLCTNCRQRLPLNKWAMELVGGLTFFGVWWHYFGGAWPRALMDWCFLILWGILLWAILVLFVSDLVYDELPVAPYLVALLAAFGVIVFRQQNLFLVLFTAVGAGFLLLLLHVLSNYRWVHGHDVLLAILFAVLTGFSYFLVGLVLTYILAIIGGLAAWGWERPVWKGTSSFGVYLFLAFFVQGVCLLL